MITQKDIELLKDELSKIFVTKEEFRLAIDKITTRMDKFLAIFTRVDQEQTLLSNKVDKHADTLESRDKRLTRLEHRPITS